MLNRRSYWLRRCCGAEGRCPEAPIPIVRPPLDSGSHINAPAHPPPKRHLSRSSRSASGRRSGGTGLLGGALPVPHSSAELKGGRVLQALPFLSVLSGLVVTALSLPETPGCAGSPARVVRSVPSAQHWEQRAG